MDAPKGKIVEEILNDEKATKDLVGALRESQKNGSGDVQKLKVKLKGKTYRLVRLRTVSETKEDKKQG